MASSTSALGAFPSPFSIETPPGCEGWEEMYPYYALFDERRRDTDENRFWFWNSMHFPVPMPAFDVICIDSPYQAVGSWQNRVFAVPPAMGIDYRCVNGYIYISGNPVTDPAKIAERAEFCKAQLPDIPDQHIAQMVAGIDVLLFRPDAELRRLARLALETGVDAAFGEERSPAEIEAELGQTDAGRAWLAQ